MTETDSKLITWNAEITFMVTIGNLRESQLCETPISQNIENFHPILIL